MCLGNQGIFCNVATRLLSFEKTIFAHRCICDCVFSLKKVIWKILNIWWRLDCSFKYYAANLQSKCTCNPSVKICTHSLTYHSTATLLYSALCHFWQFMHLSAILAGLFHLDFFCTCEICLDMWPYWREIVWCLTLIMSTVMKWSSFREVNTSLLPIIAFILQCMKCIGLVINKDLGRYPYHLVH